MREPPQVTARRAAALGNRQKQLPGKPLREGTALTPLTQFDLTVSFPPAHSVRYLTFFTPLSRSDFLL